MVELAGKSKAENLGGKKGVRDGEEDGEKRKKRNNTKHGDEDGDGGDSDWGDSAPQVLHSVPMLVTLSNSY